MRRRIALVLVGLVLSATLSEAQIEYYHVDALGSVRVVTNQAGEVVRRHDFLPFGEEYPAPVSWPDRQLFTGQERDGETGLDYFGARYYRADIGRFTTIDPVYTWQENLEDPQRWNRYSYVRNNPLRYVDPDGRRLDLPGNKDDRERIMDALRTAVGDEAAALLRIAFLKGQYYVAVSDMSVFRGTNSVANKLGGLIADRDRVATLGFVAPGTRIGEATVGPGGYATTPGVTLRNDVSITRGPLGVLRGALSETFEDVPAGLPEILTHELAHVDAAWYHPGLDSKTAAVRFENEVRRRLGLPLRTGHDYRGDLRRRP